MVSHSIAQASVLIDAGTLAVGAVGIVVGFIGTIVVQRMQAKASEARLDREDALRVRHWHREQQVSVYGDYLALARRVVLNLTSAEDAILEDHDQSYGLMNEAALRGRELRDLKPSAAFLASEELAAQCDEFEEAIVLQLRLLRGKEMDKTAQDLPEKVARIRMAMQTELGLTQGAQP